MNHTKNVEGCGVRSEHLVVGREEQRAGPELGQDATH